jgi:hypothetical protein
MPRNSNVERMQKMELSTTGEKGIPRRMIQAQDHLWGIQETAERGQESGGARKLRGLCGCRTARRITATVYIGSNSESGYCTTPATAQLDTVDAHRLFVLPREGQQVSIVAPHLSPSLWQYTSLRAARSTKSSTTIKRDKRKRWCTWKWKKYNESAHMACSTNPISQPSLDISPIWIPLISNEVSNRRDLHDATDSSCFSIRFQFRVFRFYSADGASGRYYMSSYFFLFVCIRAHTLGFVAAQISTSFSILFQRMCVLYHNFYCIFSYYHAPNQPGLRWPNNSVNLPGIVQWMRLAHCKGPNWVGVFSPHLRTEIASVSETLCFLFSRIPVDGKSPKTQ